MTEISLHEFIKKLISITHIFEVWTAYRSCLNNDNNFWNDKSNFFNNFINMLKKLHQKYYDFFNIQNVNQLISHQIIDHVIYFKSDIKSSYMHIYNMFSIELKTLNHYFNNILIKKWIHKFQNFINTLIFFIFWKSNKLYLCINYHELNVIIIKNHYFLLLTSKLLD